MSWKHVDVFVSMHPSLTGKQPEVLYKREDVAENSYGVLVDKEEFTNPPI